MCSTLETHMCLLKTCQYKHSLQKQLLIMILNFNIHENIQWTQRVIFFMPQSYTYSIGPSIVKNFEILRFKSELNECHSVVDTQNPCFAQSQRTNWITNKCDRSGIPTTNLPGSDEQCYHCIIEHLFSLYNKLSFIEVFVLFILKRGFSD